MSGRQVRYAPAGFMTILLMIKYMMVRCNRRNELRRLFFNRDVLTSFLRWPASAEFGTASGAASARFPPSRAPSVPAPSVPAPDLQVDALQAFKTRIPRPLHDHTPSFTYLTGPLGTGTDESKPLTNI